MNPHTTKAAANEPVRWAIAPVSHGAMMPATLPPKFWMPDTVPTRRFVQHACVMLQVLGAATPRPQSEINNSQTDVPLSWTRPAGTMASAIAKPIAMNVLRTRNSRNPAAMSRSVATPDSTITIDMTRNGTDA